MTQKVNTDIQIHIDTLLQDTYLLVVELLQGAAVEQGASLWKHCTEQVEKTRRALGEAGYADGAIDQICYAQCALLDETVLNHAAGESHAAWASKPLQAHFFNRHQAGFQLYEDICEALAEREPNKSVLTCYHRVLLLGFKGRYRDASSPEREQLVSALAEHVEPLSATPQALTFATAPVLPGLRLLNAPWLHVLMGSLVLGVLWWTLDQLLLRAVASLLVDKG